MHRMSAEWIIFLLIRFVVRAGVMFVKETVGAEYWKWAADRGGCGARIKGGRLHPPSYPTLFYPISTAFYPL